MKDCMLWRSCVNRDSQKCSICWNMVRNFGHYVYFKDKTFYEVRLPYSGSLKWLFEKV